MAKTVITCALTGAQQGKEANPNLPEQPHEIIQQGVDAWRAGAAVLHLHARDRNGWATGDVAVFRQIVSGLRAAGCDAVINLTTGGAVAGLPLEERLAVIPALRPQIASFSAGSGCLLGRRNQEGGGWARDQYVPLFQSYAEMERVARLMRQYGTKPEIEIYHPGMLNNLHELDAMGVFDHPLLVNFVMGIPGEVTPAEVSDLQFMVGKLPGHARWHVTGIGARNHFRITTAAVLLGGHLRVGMEDNVYIGPGELAKSNAQLVEKSVRILRELGEAPASPAEAKAILGVREDST